MIVSINNSFSSVSSGSCLTTLHGDDRHCSGEVDALLKAIRCHDSHRCSLILDSVCEEHRKEVFLMLYDRLVSSFRDETSCDPDGFLNARLAFRKAFFFFMTHIYTRYPRLADYMIVENDPELDAMVVSPKLTPEGVRCIINYLQKKGSLALSCEVYDDCEGFEKMLRDVDGDAIVRKLCIVRATSSADLPVIFPHVVPVYMEKRVDSPHIFFIPDSMGEQFFIEPLQASILNVFPEAHMYISLLKRQYDNSSCSLFALRDIVNISREENGVDFLQQIDSDQLNEVTYINFETLPMVFIKTMQSVRAVRERLFSENENAECAKGELSAMVWDHMRKHILLDSKNEEYNISVEMRFYKYVRIFLQSIL